ncbi:hypothetical protein JTM26_31980, partial [Pseudomonas aeruginosa]|nr:hypothetical protein [Pseudomonas aeruginosa]
FFLLVNSASAKVICMGTDSVLTNWAILPRYAPGMGFVQRLPKFLFINSFLCLQGTPNRTEQHIYIL